MWPDSVILLPDRINCPNSRSHTDFSFEIILYLFINDTFWMESYFFLFFWEFEILRMPNKTLVSCCPKNLAVPNSSHRTETPGIVGSLKLGQGQKSLGLVVSVLCPTVKVVFQANSNLVTKKPITRLTVYLNKRFEYSRSELCTNF